MTTRKHFVALSIIIIIFINCCNSNFDASNPHAVIEKFLNNLNEEKYAHNYNLISSDSKKQVNEGEFKQYYQNNYKISRNIELEEVKISVSSATFRRFKIKPKIIRGRGRRNNNDISLLYLTLKNENDNWRIAWNETLLDLAWQKFDNGEYEEVINLANKSLEIDPFDSEAFSHKGWSYRRDKTINIDLREKNILNNFKYAISYEPDIPAHYNSMAAYYSFMELDDLAIESYEKAIKLSKQDYKKGLFYPNIASIYLDQKKYKKAEEFVKKAFDVGDYSAFNWYTFGNILHSQNKLKSAREKYEKALERNPISETYLQGKLHYKYSSVCFSLGENEKAKEHIQLALNITPNNKNYISLYNKIKSKK